MKTTLLWRGGVLVCITGVMMAFGAQAATCQVSASVVSFGSFSPLTMNFVDSTGDITVNCTDVAGYSVALLTGNGTYSLRNMVAGGQTLEYNLYRDAAYQQIWGDGNSGDNFDVTNTNPVDGQNYVHTVYGRIPLISQRGTHPGTYTDTINIIVTY
ncbi:Csu type fimbrial protein [Aliidiomarina indica]|uniref:Csu type fimbrial protein n=1 Tax=Aliidiomarina indica TaxID=2749147 RepID=UPI00188F6CF2|nr:spore coat U domain-containing protein [Aliidiomarina indica]